MDVVSRAFYELNYELAYVKRKGDEFQDFFCSIMEKRYPADFIRVRPWGRSGDWKNDGYLRSQRRLFQSYAPNDLEAAKTIAKIETDFSGALPYWKAHFDTWVFVHNSRIGLGPEVTKKLLDLGQANAPLGVKWWGFEELRQEAFQLVEAELASLFGPCPSRQGMVDLGLAELAPVLDQIALLPASSEQDLRPVPADKVKKNLLSDHVAVLLTAGMSRADLVARCFATLPTRQDQLAQSFQTYYQKLRSQTLAPDLIFSELQAYAGGQAIPSPSRQSAVLAVLAFFFEACDIFERPQPEESTS